MSSSSSEEETQVQIKKKRKTEHEIRSKGKKKKLEAKDESSDEEVAEEEDNSIHLREELSSMTFEELLRLKNNLGTKVFNATAFQGKQRASDRQTCKRQNKNRPSEVSSKVPVKSVKQVFPTKKLVRRDPRFDNISGEYNETFFHNAYGFLSDIRQREKQKLSKSIKKEKDVEQRQKMENLLKRMMQQEKNEEQKKIRQEQEKEWKKKEKELVLKGKAPFYMKKSDKKKLEQSENLSKLKEKGQLDKYMKKKEKKLLSKDRKHFSFL